MFNTKTAEISFGRFHKYVLPHLQEHVWPGLTVKSVEQGNVKGGSELARSMDFSGVDLVADIPGRRTPILLAQRTQDGGTCDYRTFTIRRTEVERYREYEADGLGLHPSMVIQSYVRDERLIRCGIAKYGELMRVGLNLFDAGVQVRALDGDAKRFVYVEFNQLNDLFYSWESPRPAVEDRQAAITIRKKLRARA